MSEELKKLKSKTEKVLFHLANHSDVVAAHSTMIHSLFDRFDRLIEKSNIDTFDDLAKILKEKITTYKKEEYMNTRYERYIVVKFWRWEVTYYEDGRIYGVYNQCSVTPQQAYNIITALKDNLGG